MLFCPGKASFPPWLISHAGSAVEGSKALDCSPEDLFTSLFPLLVPYDVKSAFIKNKLLFNGLTLLPIGCLEVM